jgi:glycosyltransferase involved in cell wall biosynthesis
MSEETKVTVIIPTMPHLHDYLKLCVESLREQCDWDIIVVSNGTNEKPNYRDIHGITQHLHTRQQGQCNAVNIGAQVAHANTDYFFISNDDMYYAPTWKDKLKFEHPVFSPNLVEPTDNNGSAPPFLKFDGGFTLDAFNRGGVNGFIEKEIERAESADSKETGFNFPLFVRADVWRKIGGYDTKYDPWGSNSDTDLQTLIHYAGIQPMRLNDVLVYHFSNKAGTFDFSHPDRQQKWQQNFDYYTEKWGFNRDTEPTDVWASTGVLPEDESKIKFEAVWKDQYRENT